jgi:hypothetical protein
MHLLSNRSPRKSGSEKYLYARLRLTRLQLHEGGIALRLVEFVHVGTVAVLDLSLVGDTFLRC